MTGPLYRLGWFCTRHHWPVIAVWIAGGRRRSRWERERRGQQNSDNLSLPGTGSTNAQDLLQAKLPKQAYGTNPVVLQAKSGSSPTRNNKQAVGQHGRLAEEGNRTSSEP